jgi:hypothetical protein
MLAFPLVEDPQENVCGLFRLDEGPYPVDRPRRRICLQSWHYFFLSFPYATAQPA